MTNDVHVGNATRLHQSLPWFYFSQAYFTIFRVLTHMLILKTLSVDWSVATQRHSDTETRRYGDTETHGRRHGHRHRHADADADADADTDAE